MMMSDLIARYAHAHPYGLEPSSLEQYRWAVHALQQHLGRAVDLDALSVDDLNTYLDWLREHRAASTVKSRRGHLMALLRYARREGLTRCDLERVRRLRTRRHVVEAWTPDEVRRLIDAAQLLRGELPMIQIPASLWWSSWIMAAWDTALRVGDLLSLERSWLMSDGQGGATVTIVQHKTGHQHRVRLGRDTMRAVQACWDAQPERRLIWPMWARREAFYARFKRLVQSAGIRPGTARWLRRGSVTSVERQRPGAGQIQAGHQSAETTRRHYLDAGQLADIPMPERVVNRQ